VNVTPDQPTGDRVLEYWRCYTQDHPDEKSAGVPQRLLDPADS
jgi:hypothetical protein